MDKTINIDVPTALSDDNDYEDVSADFMDESDICDDNLDNILNKNNRINDTKPEKNGKEIDCRKNDGKNISHVENATNSDHDNRCINNLIPGKRTCVASQKKLKVKVSFFLYCLFSPPKIFIL